MKMTYIRVLWISNLYLKLIIVFGITYYLKLHNEITMYSISHAFANKGQIGRLDIIEQ